MKKNIFIVPLAAAVFLLGAAMLLSPMETLPLLLSLLGLASAAAAVFMARNTDKNNTAALLQSVENACRDKNAALPADASEGLKRLVLVVKDLAASRDSAIEALESMTREAQEYKTQLEDELEHGKKRSAEQDELQRSLRYKTHRTQLVYNSLAGEIHHLSQMVADIGHGMETQKYGIQQTRDAMAQIVGGMDVVSKSVSTASEKARASLAKTNSGQTSVSGAVKVMDSASSSFQELNEAMRLLQRQSENISQIMNVINEVADQTTKLAVSSAIEAARAGEAGQGFVTHAEEVRKLAEKTIQATTEMRGVVNEIQGASKQNIRAVAEVSASIAESSKQLGQAESIMGEAAQGIAAAADEMSKIQGTVNEHAENSRQADYAIQDIYGVIRSSAGRMTEFTGRLVSIADSVEELEITTGMLKGLSEYESTSRSRIVEWQPALATGIELIDFQHKMLCLYINTLYRATVNGADMKTLIGIVDFLKVYTATHFATEERFFDLSGYPDAASHKQIHQKFVEKVVQVQKDLYSGNITIGNELLGFLKDWLVNHIRGTDHDYAAFLKNYLASAKEQG